MAADEFLVHLVSLDPAAVYLRLYTWAKSAITLGQHQRIESAIDLSRVGETPVIRRVTGGRALFHDKTELTYSIAYDLNAVRNAKLNGTLSDSSAVIAEALARFLRANAIDANWQRKSGEIESSPAMLHKAPCFASHARYELLQNGRKIVASAQRRLGNLVLQHGAIKINGVSSHPALSQDLPMERKSLNGIVMNEGSFNALAESYQHILSSHLNLRPVSRDFGQDERRLLARHRQALLENPLDRRNPVKHYRGANSLLDTVAREVRTEKSA